MVNTLQNFWHKHRKLIFMMTLLLVTILVMPHLVHADTTTTAAPAAPPDTGTNDMLKGLTQVVSFLQRIFWPVLVMIGSLMQNDILFGSGMEARLMEVWVNVRNIVNIFFVLILLGIALYNVLGAGENYHFKTILPKFIIGLIAVNFTFIGLKVALDAVNVLTTAIYALPASVQAELQKNAAAPPATGILSVDAANSLCGAIFGGVNINDPDQLSTYQTNVTNASTSDPNTPCSPNIDSTTQSYMNANGTSQFSQLSARNAALVMAINFGNSNKFDSVYVDSTKLTSANIAINILFTILLFIIYGTAFVALFVALLIRLVALWVMIALSPFMILPFVVPALKEVLGEGGDLAHKFIKNAIMPLPIAVVMAIGDVMLTGFNDIKFSQGSFANTPTLSMNVLTSGITSLQQLIMGFGMVAFVWTGVFAAFDGTFAKGITDQIKGTVEGAGKTIGKFAAGSIPLFPVKGPEGKEKMANVSDVMHGIGGIKPMLERKEREHAEGVFEYLKGDAGAVQKMGTAKNWKDFSANANRVNKEGMGADYQKNTDKYLAVDPAGRAKFQDAVGRAGYTSKSGSGWAAFQKDLKAGTVNPEDMDRVVRAAGITPGSVFEAPAKNLKDAALKGGLSPVANDLLDPKKVKDQKLDQGLNADQKKRLGEIQKTLKDPKASQVDKDKATEDLKALAKTIEDTNNQKANLDITLKDNINRNMKKDATTDNVAAMNKDIQDKIDATAKSKGITDQNSPAYKAVVKEVMDKATADIAAVKGARGEDVEAVSKIATAQNAPLLRQALDQAAPAAPKLPKPTEPKPKNPGVAGQSSPGGEWLNNGTDWIQVAKPPKK